MRRGAKAGVALAIVLSMVAACGGDGSGGASGDEVRLSLVRGDQAGLDQPGDVGLQRELPGSSRSSP